MSIYVGSDKISKIYQGSILIYQSEPDYPSDSVDLGLSSGLLWCTHNIGCTTPAAFGLGFQFGDTVGAIGGTTGAPAASYSTWSTSPCNGSNSSADNSSISAWDETYLDSTFVLYDDNDAAVQHMTKGWRMPQPEDFSELISNTTQEYTTLDGKYGWKFINKTDSSKYIFLPLLGFYNNTTWEQNNTTGLYWSSQAVAEGDTSAFALWLTTSASSETDGGYVDEAFRNFNAPIRPVFDINKSKN